MSVLGSSVLWISRYHSFMNDLTALHPSPSWSRKLGPSKPATATAKLLAHPDKQLRNFSNRTSLFWFQFCSLATASKLEKNCSIFSVYPSENVRFSVGEVSLSKTIWLLLSDGWVSITISAMIDYQSQLNWMTTVATESSLDSTL